MFKHLLICPAWIPPKPGIFLLNGTKFHRAFNAWLGIYQIIIRRLIPSEHHQEENRVGTESRDSVGRNQFVRLEGPSNMVKEFSLPDTWRRAIRSKAIGTYAVEQEFISLEDACQRNGISPEEFESWRRLIEQHEIGGLLVTRLA